MKFLVDENLGKRFTNLLIQEGHDAISVIDVLTGADDQKVLSRAKNENRIFLTNDLDFGELIFKLKLPAYGVILFRTLTRNPEELFALVKPLLDRDLKNK
ncbi:MAG: DUF5615 family PIN-like protein, partial [Candidatus Aenigmarchaeota archaeon]|nr:DUF5615 family PIN-like protein [Candidatus Aenigmarchaeota archaeon]